MSHLVLATIYLCSATYAKVLIGAGNTGYEDETSLPAPKDYINITDSTTLGSMERSDNHIDLKDSWLRHKVVYTNMKSQLEEIYGSGSQMAEASNKILDPLLAATDTANLIQYTLNRVDSELKTHLMNKFLANVDPEEIIQTIKGSSSYQFLNNNYPLQLDLFLDKIKPGNHILVDNLWSDFIKFIKGTTNKGIIQLGKVLSNGIKEEENDFNFIGDLMESCGFKVEEIALIFRLMGLEQPKNVRRANEIRRSLRTVNKTLLNIENHRNPRSGYSYNDGYGYNEGYGYNDGQGIGSYGYGGGGGYDHNTGYSHDDGYGNSGSYDGYGYDSGGYDSGGHDGGYGGMSGYMSSYMEKIDPFMIIAGMAFLSLLCYLAYLAVSKYCGTATGMGMGICGRSIGDPYLDLTDTQRLAFDAIDRSHLTYEFQDQNTNVLSDEVIDVVNSIWTAYNNGTANEDEDHLPTSQPVFQNHGGKTCARATLCSLTAEQPKLYDALSLQAETKKLFGSFIALLLGVPCPGALVDQVYTKQVEGEEEPCKHLQQTCSNVYSQ
ncbi:unnamed protein product [Meganyctiphanes norvegica]|uniref:Uncharacterized protein n=1 Tax=Meganyctiphanes norvegica TaxID=48144 RepID=A0AAV2QL12_MEGNR